ncbi:MAG: polyhydroxyalkanoate synthesis regulator DNA-binding domain-containing protein [Thermoguttaceae bacterium]
MANDLTTDDPTRVQLRRYSNRRYYDAARSQHLTLEDIFRLICEGRQVQVNDSKTGEDITVRVLAQLILSQAPGKLAALPAELLHQIIRSNESLLREFVDKYFYRALSAFIESQREFDRYLRRALGLTSTAQFHHSAPLGQSLSFLAPNWAAMMMEPFARALLSGSADTPSIKPDRGRGEEEPDMRKALEELTREVEALRKELKKR